ncbi:unnamed protein product [Bathycoccus prasinos]
MQEQRENGKVTNDFSSCGSFSSTSFKTFALFAEASATNDDEKPPTNETRPSDKVTEVGLRRRVEENVFAVDVGGATTGDMNTANVDEDEENAEDKDERKTDDDDKDDDEEYVPSNDERDSNSEYIETGMGEGTGKPKRKASNQKATSRASAKRAKKKQLPETRVVRELDRDERLLFEKLRKKKASIDASLGTNKEKYEEFTTLLENLVEDLISSVIGEALSCTKTALPGGGEGEWDENGERLRNFDALVFGHFETAEHNLGGNLLAARSDLENNGLRATVWNLLWYYGVNLFNFVVTNIVPWAAPHDHGNRILSGIPPDVISFVNELTKAKLGCLGEPKKVAGFGAHVRTFANNQGYTNVRVPWTFHFDSPHLSLFTTSAPRALWKEDYDAFGALVDFLDGKEGAGEDLCRAREGEDEDETTREMIRARQSEAVRTSWRKVWRNHQAAGTLHPSQVGTRAFWRNHQVAGTLHPAQIGIKKKAKDRGTVQIPPGFVCDSCGHSCEREVSFTIDKRRGTFRRRCSYCYKRNKKQMTASYTFTKLTSIRKFFDGGRACFNTSEKKKAFADIILGKINSELGLSEFARRAEIAMNEYFSHRDLYMLRVADQAAYEVETGMQSQADMDQEAMWRAYIAELRRGPIPNTSFGWGDDITLRAAANFYGVQIQVYGGSEILVENLNGTAERTLHLFCADCHYTSLRERTE